MYAISEAMTIAEEKCGKDEVMAVTICTDNQAALKRT